MASGSDDATVRIWDLEKRQAIKCVADFNAACDDSGQTKIIEVAKKKLYDTLAKKHTNGCSSVMFRPQSKNELLTGSMDYSIIHWDYLKGKLLHREFFQATTTPVAGDGVTQQQILNPPFVHSIDVSATGKHVAIGLGNADVSNDITQLSIAQ
eukprot:gene14482-17086_t